MLTEGQIKNLKKGDKLIAELSFIRFDCENDIVCSVPSTLNGIVSEAFFHTSCISLPPAEPKYDPCRRYKKGDVVRVVAWHGREADTVDESPMYNAYGSEKDTFVVTEDEMEGLVEVEDKYDGCVWAVVHVCNLELVAPVEEQEPYIITEYEDFYAVEKDGAHYSIFYKGSYHDNAKEAAETECARLNETYRKEPQ